MGTSSSNKPQVTTENKDPWGPAQPYLLKGLQNAQTLVDNDIGFKPWMGPTQADLDPRTTEALAGSEALARAGNPLAKSAYDFAGTVASGGAGLGMDGLYQQLGQNMNNNSHSLSTQAQNLFRGSQDTLNGLTGDWRSLIDQSKSLASGASAMHDEEAGAARSIMSGAEKITTDPQYQAEWARNLGPTASTTNLAAMGRGELRNPDQYLLGALNAADDTITDKVNANAAGAGRYGSGAHTGVLTRELAKARLPILADNYQRGTDRMLSASGQMDSAEAQKAGTRLNALGGSTNVQNQNIQNKLAAAGLLGGFNSDSFNSGLKGVAGTATALQGAGKNALDYAGLDQQRWQDMFTNNQAHASNNMGLLSGMTGQRQQDFTNRMGAAGMADSLYGSLFSPNQRLAGIGDFYGQREQTDLDKLIETWNAAEARPWEQIGRMNAIASGAGGMGGTTVTTKPPTGPTSAQQALGYAGAGASLLKTLFG